MATLMRCTTPHWQGNKFVDVGTVLPEGHDEVIDEFFAPLEVDEPKPKSSKASKSAS
jgi:hypothetical protein